MRDKSKIFIIMAINIAFITISTSSGSNGSRAEKRTNSWNLIRKAQKQKADSINEHLPMRILHFPKERSIGTFRIVEKNPDRDSTPFGYPFEQIRWQSSGFARGDVEVPAGKWVQLILDPLTWQNPEYLSALRQLKPDDIYSLVASPYWSSSDRPPSDGCMPYVAHLTGLKILNLDGANITARGLKYITELKSLERLKPPSGLDDTGMIHIGKLKSLKVLYIYGNNTVTNKGLKQLLNLRSLELLALNSVRMTDEGLDVLLGLPYLNHLILDGNFTNDAILYLKDTDSLRTLTVGIVSMDNTNRGLTLMQTFNDRGMQHISNLTQLENLNLHWIEGVTDNGISYLKNMPDLKKLDISHSKVTDRGLSYLRALKTLDCLNLPDKGISDEGLTYIGRMSSLRNLDISRIHYTDPDNDKGYYTDIGVAELTKCKLLEELSIGSLGLTDEGMKHIATLTNLRRLNLFGCSNVTSDGLTKLDTLKSLRNLSIHSADITVGGLSFLNKLPNLTTLKVDHIRQDGSIMDISGLTELDDIILNLHRWREGNRMMSDSFKNEDWACLSNLKQLRRLQITGVGIDDDGVKHLSGLTNLEFLNIICPGESRITDEALKYLMNMKKLNRLYIKDGHFTDKALEYLDNLPSLTWLELTSDDVFSNQAIREFQQKNHEITRLVLMP